jgi:tetratricopeptide (TPR) repeat protein
LREARRESGLSFREFASLAGFSESHLRNVENGHRAVTEDVVAAYDRVLAAAASLPWTQPGAQAAIAGLASGGGLDRREFVTASSATLTMLSASWRGALARQDPLSSENGSRQVQPQLVTHIGQRLAYLRRLDDELGGGELAQMAQAELVLAARLLKDGSYTAATGGRLYSLAAEASRQAAWAYFDQDNHGAARRCFETALRASAAAGDPVTGAYTLSFMAVQSYSTGEAQQAISLLETARDTVAGLGSARMTAMLTARSARAHSKVGHRKACAQLLNEACSALDRGPCPDDPDVLYWVTYGEIEMIAGSSAFDLGDHAQAIRCFDGAIQANYRGDDQYPRSHAIYLARAAEAYLALHDLDAAIERANHAVRCLGGVDSARSATAVKNLRARLAPHAAAPRVRDFLDATRPLAPAQSEQLPQPCGGRLLVKRVDDRHPHYLCRDQVLLGVIGEHARLRRHAQAVQCQLEDRRVWLPNALVIREDRHVEVLAEVVGGVRVVWVPTERVG